MNGDKFIRCAYPNKFVWRLVRYNANFYIFSEKKVQMSYSVCREVLLLSFLLFIRIFPRANRYICISKKGQRVETLIHVYKINPGFVVKTGLCLLYDTQRIFNLFGLYSTTKQTRDLQSTTVQFE